MQPGDDTFYGWICSSKFYYPHARWEWVPLLDVLCKEGKVRVIDVGCGSGLFLEAVRERGLQGVGLDANSDSVQTCLRKGLVAMCIGLENINAAVTERYDAITMFHVMEHLSNPVAALISLRRLLKPGGLIAVSVPYSPMSFETDWRDPLNRPPHHLTRWNEASLRSLAVAAGLKARIVVQPTRSVLSRTLSTLQLKRGLPAIAGGSRGQRALGFAMRLARWPLLSAGIWLRQRQRDAALGGAKGDAVLMILSEEAS
ncbi:MAG: class I SAM-dependent methyltransferase [Gallionellaceae bacterium]